MQEVGKCDGIAKLQGRLDEGRLRFLGLGLCDCESLALGDSVVPFLNMKLDAK